MIKICVAGACGRMGRRILELASQEGMVVGGAFDVLAKGGMELAIGHESGSPEVIKIGDTAEAALVWADVMLDFTVADAVLANVAAAADVGIPVVVGTSGLSSEQKKALTVFADKVPIVVAANTSTGVNVLFKLAREAAALLGQDYDVEITEIHHNKKVDSPSGTAVRLAEQIAEVLGLDYEENVVHGRQGLVGERPVTEIGVHSLRGGDVAGEHTVSFIGQGERIELIHRAHSRDTFARGALRAARFAVNADPGLYDMEDALGLKSL